MAIAKVKEMSKLRNLHRSIVGKPVGEFVSKHGVNDSSGIRSLRFRVGARSAISEGLAEPNLYCCGVVWECPGRLGGWCLWGVWGFAGVCGGGDLFGG